MKILLLIFVTISVGLCDRLDRTYLPLRGSKVAGGSPGAILGPLNASYNSNKDGLRASANVDFISASENSQNQHLITASPPSSYHGNRYRVPTTINSFAFTPTTTSPPTYNFSNESSIEFKEHDYESERLQPMKQVVSSQTNKNGINISKESPTSETFNISFYHKHFNNVAIKTKPQFSFSDSQQDNINQQGLIPHPSKKTDINDNNNNNYFPTFQARAQITNKINEKPSLFSKKINNSYQSFDLLPNQDVIPFENLHLQGNHNINSNRVPLKYLSKDLSQLPSGFVGQLSTPTSIIPENYHIFGKSNTEKQNQEHNLTLNNSPENIQTESDRYALILNFANILKPEGDFLYNFNTSNGIHAFESGSSKYGVKAQGAFSYIGDDGKNYSITYTADENGYLPQGDHLPTPPPIPEAILKVVQEANKDKEAGIFHDGSYDDERYGYKNYEKPNTSKGNLKHDYELKKLPMTLYYETGKDEVYSDMDEINSHKNYSQLDSNGVKSNKNNAFGTELTNVKQYDDSNFPMNNPYQENAEVFKKDKNSQKVISYKKQKPMTNDKLEEQSPEDIPSKILSNHFHISNLNQKLPAQSTDNETRNRDDSFRYPISKTKNPISIVDEVSVFIAKTQKNPIASESASAISDSGDYSFLISQRYPDLESQNLIPRHKSNLLQYSPETGYQYIPPQNPFSQDFSDFQKKKPSFIHPGHQNRNNTPFITPNFSFKEKVSLNDIEFSKDLQTHRYENPSQKKSYKDITTHTTENIERQSSSEKSQTPEADFHKTQRPIFGQKVHSAHDNNNFNNKLSIYKHTSNGNKNILSPTSIPTEHEVTDPEITHRIQEYRKEPKPTYNPLTITTVPFSISQSNAPYDKKRPSSINRNNSILTSGILGKDPLGINVPSTTYRPMYFNNANNERIQKMSQKFDELTTTFGSVDNNLYSTEMTNYQETSSPTLHSENTSPLNHNGYHTSLKMSSLTNEQDNFSYTTYKPDSNVYNYMTTPMRSLHETTIGKDFTGPKQPQYFDPITGYHY